VEAGSSGCWAANAAAIATAGDGNGEGYNLQVRKRHKIQFYYAVQNLNDTQYLIRYLIGILKGIFVSSIIVCDRKLDFCLRKLK